MGVPIRDGSYMAIYFNTIPVEAPEMVANRVPEAMREIT
jgi:hypothetical protein